MFSTRTTIILILKCKSHQQVKIIKYINSKEIEIFIQDVKDDISSNLDGMFSYYGFLENHDIRKIVIDPNDELSFFEGAVVGMLDQRYCEFFRSRFNTDIYEIVRIDILEIIKSHLPDIRKKLN